MTNTNEVSLFDAGQEYLTKENKVTTKVIFRVDKHDGEVIALFPELAGDSSPATMLYYAHVGQHGAAHMNYVREDTRPANYDEYQDLIKELESVGYDDLQVVERMTHKQFMNRYYAVARIK